MVVKQNIDVDDDSRAMLVAQFPEMTADQAGKLVSYARYQNSDKGSVKGLQFNLSVNILRGFNLSANYAYTYARSKSAGESDEWQPLERSIRHTATVAANYHRSWSRFLNTFRSETQVGPAIAVRPDSPVIHKGRNTLYEQDGFIIKAFAKPGWVKAWLYGLFVPGKARRSFEYAECLLASGIATPRPVAYREVRVLGMLRESEYVSAQSACGYTFNALIGQPSFPNREAILRSIGAFVAKMHEAGVLHRDLSGGNILFDEKGRVEVVDLNRIRWCKHIGLEKGCKNFERLNIDREALTVMAKAYAAARGLDEQACVDYILSHRWWKHVRRGITNL